MAEIDQHREQVSVTTVRTHLSYFTNDSVERKDVFSPNELFWQDIEKKIEETRQRFKNEFLQGKTVILYKLTLTCSLTSHLLLHEFRVIVSQFISDIVG